MVAARSALGPRRRPGVAALRAGPRRLRVASADRGRPLEALERQHRGAAAARRPSTRTRRSPISNARCSRSRRRRRPSSMRGVRFFEGAGTRGTLELVGEELLALIRAGTAPEQIALVAPTLDSWRAPLETVLSGLGVPYAIESHVRLGSTPLGHALLQLLRYAWADAGRRELFTYLRSPYSGLARSSVDFVEGRLRGRAIHTPARVEEEAEKLREGPIPQLAELRAAATPTAGVRALIRSMLRAAYGTEAPPAGETSRLDLRSYDAALRLLDELDAFAALGEQLTTRRRARGAGARRCAARLGKRRRAGRGARSDEGPHAAVRRSCSCSGWKRGRCLAARASRRSSTTTRGASSAAGSSGPIRSAATATSSTPRARVRRGACTSCARQRPTTARRANRARSGRRSPAVFDEEDVVARDRRGGRSPRSRGRSKRADRARAGARARAAQ